MSVLAEMSGYMSNRREETRMKTAEERGFGRNINVRIYGESHAEKIGVIIEGIEKGMPIDHDALRGFMARRAPGKNPWSTPRKEDDEPVFLSGVEEGITTGETIEAVIFNRNIRPGDYDNIKTVPRPSHADYPAWVRYGEIPSGGGRFSGRMTAALCVAGCLCKQWLESEGVIIKAHIYSIGDIRDGEMDVESRTGVDFATVSEKAGEEMKGLIAEVHSRGDSVGGVIECKVFGMPTGVGEPIFGSLEGAICQSVFAVPAVKGIEFGRGFDSAKITGSENNDPFRIEEGRVVTSSNNHGGILGGLTSGMPLVIRTAMKPTPSIGIEQRSVDLARMEDAEIKVKGRHDPCIVPRAVPCIEAAVAIAVYDAFSEWRSQWIDTGKI